MLHWAPRMAEDSKLAPHSKPAQVAGLQLEAKFDLESARPLWEAFEAGAVCTPFQCWAWLAQWARKSARQRPLIVFGHQGGAVKLILPLALEDRFGATSLGWLGQDVSDYNGPIIEADLLHRLTAEDVGDILRASARLAGGADSLKLEKQPEFLGETANPFALYNATAFTCRAHATRLTGDWEAFHAQKRSRKSAKRLREKISSLARQGEIAFEEVRDPAERRTVVELLLSWKSAQLEARGSRNPFHNASLRELLIAGATDPELSKLIRLHALKVGGRLAAGALGLQRAGHYIYFVAAYDAERFSRHSPGAILLTRLIEALHGEGLKLFDFSNGDERYKDEWCDLSMDLTVTLVPLTLKGRIAIAIEAASLRLIREIKSRPQLFSAVRALTSRLRGLRRAPSPSPA